MFDWITGFVEWSGYLGIALLMLAENIFPPLPSELIMPLAGYAAARGDLHIIGVIAAGSSGSLLGALLWYWIGYRIGADRLLRWTDRHGRWMTLHPDEVQKALSWFGRRGRMAVLIGRMAPTVRTLVSVPAGIARMPLVPFLSYSALGTICWTAALAGAGYLLQAGYGLVGGWLEIVTNAIFGIVVVIYLYRVLTFRPKDA